MPIMNRVDLLVSCPNDGGLVRIQDGVPVSVDNESTTGICCYEDKFLRCIQNSIDTPLKLIVYGKEEPQTLVFPEIRDVHDILAHDGKIYLVSSGSNEIFEVSSESYEILARHKFRGKGDAWHLNCLEVYENRLVVSAFGKFRRHRGYKGRTRGAGILLDLFSGEVILEGLSQPHSPKVIDGFFYICDSEKKGLNRIDMRTRETTVIEFENYTRGISFSDEHIYVGISSSRNIDQESKTSKVVVLDRLTLERMDDIPLEYGEIYGVSAVPENMELDFGETANSVVGGLQSSCYKG